MPEPEDPMQRRQFLTRTLAALAGASALRQSVPAMAQATQPEKIEKITKTPDEWRKILTPAQYAVLREEGTEYPGSSPLNSEKRKGTYLCAGCDLPLFDSKTKYDSGTGWPSFYAVIPGRVETKVERKYLYTATEYHCARCGGHHGHIFEDGPKPTGLRFCENGVALKFIPA
jgi:peptide-methionine (R)-S-oxide reductase